MADPLAIVRELEQAVLASPGETGEALRRAVEARSAALGGRSQAEAGAGDMALGEIPAALAPYVDKVARHAYRVTAEDLAALARAGWSEDAVFEITVSAAAGAGLARLERGLAALQGDER